MYIEFSDRVVNLVYRPYMSCPVRHLHFCGGGGSGKSYAAAEKKIIRCLNEEGHRFLITRKIARSIRKSQFALLLDILQSWELLRYVKVNKTEMEFTFPNGNQIVSAGLDDPEKIKSIAGLTGVWIEEATDLSEEDYNQVNLRLRGETRHYKQIISSYNPIYESHWLRKRFHIDPVDDCRVLHTTYKHNRFLDAEYITELERLAELDTEFHTIYTLGQWATPTDTIIKKWKTVPSLPDSSRVIARAYGLDFGSASPSALIEVVWAYPLLGGVSAEGGRGGYPLLGGVPAASGRGGFNSKFKGQNSKIEAPINESAPNNPHQVRMYWHEHFYRTNMSNRDIIDGLHEAGVTRSDLIAADSAEKDRIDEIYREGFNIHPANKNVRFGIDYIRRFTLHITQESTNLLKEVPAYKWRKDKGGTLLDEPVKFNDHAVDAGRYGALTGAEYFGLYKPVKPPPGNRAQQNRQRRRNGLNLDGYLS